MNSYKSIFLATSLALLFSISYAQVHNNEIKDFNNIVLKDYNLNDSSKVRLWIDNGWVNAERTDKDNSLIWRLVIYKFNGKNFPIVKTDKSQISISNAEGSYFISNSVVPIDFFQYEILRGVQEYALDDVKASFNPNIYGVTTSDSISNNAKQRLLGYEKDGWRYVSVGSVLNDNVVGLIRMQSQLLENDNPARSTEGFDALGNNHFFWDSKLIYAEQIPSAFIAKYNNAFKLLTNNVPPTINVVKWYNKPKFNSLEELKGKVVVLYFWATWCSWCLPSMSKLELLHAKYSDDGLVVIGVHHNIYKESSLSKYLEENENIKFPICVTDEKTISTYYSDSVPKYYIIGKDGLIIKSLLNKLPLEAEIVDLLK